MCRDMNLFQRLFNRAPDPREALRPAYAAVVAAARDPDWYRGGVPDTMDGRFAMVSTLLATLLLRLEVDEDAVRAPSALLAELFVEDMDAQMRLIGVGDVVVGKQIGQMMALLGGRLGALREAGGDRLALRAVLVRNVFGDSDPGSVADIITDRLLGWRAALVAADAGDLLAGRLPALPQ